jgi:hypothetical protein
LQEKYEHEMERRNGVGYDWRNAPIDGAVVHAGGDGKVLFYVGYDWRNATIFILYFDVLFKYTLYLLNIEGTRCSTG